jgi:hypothetical protein
VTNTARAWSEFPSDAFAIGDNETGDKLVFLPGQVDLRYADAVSWWDHEIAELELVADAFEELR